MSDAQPTLPTYDAGLVVVHGVGQHAKGSFLTRAVGPFLGRMRAEGSLRSVRSLSFESGVDGAERLEALDVAYAVSEGSPEKSLLVVEGRWADAYQRASPAQISAWVFRHEIPMLWQVLRYFARGSWSWAAVAALGFLIAAAVSLVRDDANHPGAAGLMVASTGLAILAGSFNFNWTTPNTRARTLGLAGAAVAFVAIAGVTFAVCWVVIAQPLGRAGALTATAGLLVVGFVFLRAVAAMPKAQWAVLGFRLVPLAAFSYQRGVVCVVTIVGLVVLPVLTALLRVIASVPGVGIVGLKGLQKLEETFFVGSNFGDMHAFADSPARFARIASAVERAVMVAETRVKPGGTVTVLAHSGGALVAWVLLTEPFAGRRLADRRYRIVTAGGALNWAQKGFDEPDLPSVDERFVNQDGDRQTLGAHIYGTWDAVPHGPFRPRTNQPEPLIPGRFNIPARNLGEPSLSEHGEYWNNQEDVVPVIGRAIDDSLPWVEAATGTRLAWNLRANARLGIVSVLTRVRVALLLVPVVALVLLLASPVVQDADERQVPSQGDTNTTAAGGNINLLYRAADRYGEYAGNCFKVSEKDADGTRLPISQSEYYEACGLASPIETVLWYAFRHASTGNAIFVALVWMLALGLVAAFRDLFWRIGGRSDASLTHPVFGIATRPQPNQLRFLATWFGLAIVPGLLWLIPLLAMNAAADIDPLVYAAGFSLSAAIAFAEWTYVRTLVEAARVVDRGELATHPLRELYELLGADVGRARAPAGRSASGRGGTPRA